jgi:hypothetical protein
MTASLYEDPFNDFKSQNIKKNHSKQSILDRYLATTRAPKSFVIVHYYFDSAI